MSETQRFTAKDIAELRRRRFRGGVNWEDKVTEEDLALARRYSFFGPADEGYRVGDVKRSDDISRIYDHAFDEQLEREERVKCARDEKKRATAEAQNRAMAQTAVPSYHKRSPAWWRDALKPITEQCSLTEDELVEHFCSVEDDYADSFQHRKGKAAGMVLDAMLSLHFFLLQSREKRVALERRVEQLELNQFRDGGIWGSGKTYEPGEFVTFAGGAWLCKQATTTKPGASDHWRLIVKRGRDGRDAAP